MLIQYKVLLLDQLQGLVIVIDKLNNFLFQCHLYFHVNLVQFNTDITKINFAMTYLTGVAQNWFKVDLNQEDQNIFEDWLSD